MRDAVASHYAGEPATPSFSAIFANRLSRVHSDEPDVSRSTRSHSDHISVLSRTCMQAVYGCGDAKETLERDIDGGALRNPDRRTGNLQWFTAFTKRIGRNGIAILALRMPIPLAQL